MISLKRYFAANGTNDTNTTEDTLRQMVALFVQKLGESAVAIDPHELESFRNETRGHRNQGAPS